MVDFSIVYREIIFYGRTHLVRRKKGIMRYLTIRERIPNAINQDFFIYTYTWFLSNQWIGTTQRGTYDE
jgi:hypothetical protein